MRSRAPLSGSGTSDCVFPTSQVDTDMKHTIVPALEVSTTQTLPPAFCIQKVTAGELAATAVLTSTGSLQKESQLQLPNISQLILSRLQDILGRLLGIILTGASEHGFTLLLCSHIISRCHILHLYDGVVDETPSTPTPPVVYEQLQTVAPDGPPRSDKPTQAVGIHGRARCLRR